MDEEYTIIGERKPLGSLTAEELRVYATGLELSANQRFSAKAYKESRSQ